MFVFSIAWMVVELEVGMSDEVEMPVDSAYFSYRVGEGCEWLNWISVGQVLRMLQRAVCCSGNGFL